jgi:hypothetical protein
MTGSGTDAVSKYAEIGEHFQRVAADGKTAGKVVRLVADVAYAVPPEGWAISLNLMVPDPGGFKTAIQYLTPAVMARGVASANEFHLPACGDASVALASREPGLPDASA